MVMRGTTGGKCYRLLPEKENTACELTLLWFKYFLQVLYICKSSFFVVFSHDCHSEHFTNKTIDQNGIQ